MRVDEAWRSGLDGIALTDHLEYQPHKDDLATGYDRWFDLAAGRAAERNLLFSKAAEITRDTPPGHFNALFLKDIKAVHTPDFVDSVKQANSQGAFVFWNHQEWKGPEAGMARSPHPAVDNKWLHGMEVCNGPEYYPDAHRWCLEKGLTMLGNSDIHEPDLDDGNQPSRRRTLTLVFAKERTLAKGGPVRRRTAVWCDGQLIGRHEFSNRCCRRRHPRNAPFADRGTPSGWQSRIKPTSRSG